MPFAHMLRDTISIFDCNGELVKENEKASVQGGKAVFTLSADYPVEIGYFVERKTPSGVNEKYKVLEPNYMAGLSSIKPHYQMSVVNVKAIPDPRATSSVTTITASGNARVYQHSVDNSTNNYSAYEFKEALNNVKAEMLDLELDPLDQALAAKALTKITEEVDSGNPNKDKINAYISLLPAAVTALDSVVKLGSMVGLG